MPFCKIACSFPGSQENADITPIKFREFTNKQQVPSGQWPQTFTVYIQVDSQSLPELLIKLFSYTPGDRIAVVCRPGFVINNSTSSVVCTSSGSWSRPLPACVKWDG